MARCERCNACESMWDLSPCESCNFPKADTRTADQIKQDDLEYDEWLKEMGCDDD